MGKSVVIILSFPIAACTYVQPVDVAVKMTVGDCFLSKGQYKNLVSL